MVTREIDTRGLPCHRPVVEAKKALDAIDEGVVTVQVDSVESRDNVQRFARSQGYQVETSEKDGVFSLVINKDILDQNRYQTNRKGSSSHMCRPAGEW